MNEVHVNHGQVVQAGHIGSVHVTTAAAAMPLTALDGLAPSSPLFVGRAGELSALADAGLVVVSGLAGVGKTELVLRHAEEHDFPGGRLFWNFHGYDDARRTTASDALGSFLRALGVVDVPAAEADRAALYRSQVAGRERMLVVLDNASTAAQVRPLLLARHQVVVTSRHRLTGLDGAVFLDLGVLGEPEATALVGDAGLARLCGRLPLALSIMRALRASDPGNDWAGEFREARLSVLVNDDRDVRAAFDLSHQQLSPEQQRFFRLLALHPGDTLTVDGAAALAELGPAVAKRLLRELRTASLVDHQNRFHDLIRAYATERAEAEPAAGRAAAEDRLIRAFGQRALATITSFGEPGAVWFEEHVRTLTAVAAMARESGRTAESVVLAWALTDFIGLRTGVATRPVNLTETGWDSAVARAARLIGASSEFISSAHARSHVSLTFHQVGLVARTQAELGLASEHGDEALVAALSSVLGLVHLGLGDYAKAIAYYEVALDTPAVVTSDPTYLVGLHSGMADALRGAGRHDEAAAHLLRAAEITERTS
ncbi:tetratricopeptide repeat protein [Nocardia sp. NRRL S-836]|uniref:tetratricopeptide repeat protein n=1 Tax=Nocardia sp. NRRL S-836 TaxID=1519492 RepID=UPI0006AF3A90|nr:tetratricopeptide repeat protein [Nocardia sp. NRRL S-836]